MNHPRDYFGICPVCDQGALGAWICGACNNAVVMCDECDATWSSPDAAAVPTYLGLPDLPCSLCRAPILLPPSHWADRVRIMELGWGHALKEETPEEDNDQRDSESAP